MILVDARVGSRELLQRLRGYGVDADLAGNLDSDFQFSGHGPDGDVLVGIERKTVQDLVNSMRDRRLAGGQIGRMLAAYDVCLLVVEGYWRRGRGTGLLEVRNGDWRVARGQIRYCEVTRFLCSLTELAGVRVWRTGDEEETCAWIADTYGWFQKEWDDHRTGQQIYAPEPVIRRKSHRASAFRTGASPVEKWLAQLPGIDSRVGELAAYFSTPKEIADAPADYWLGIQGMRLGKKTVAEIVKWIRGSE